MKKLLLILIIAVSAVSCNKKQEKQAEWRVEFGPASGQGIPNPNTGAYFESIGITAKSIGVNDGTMSVQTPTYEYKFTGRYYCTVELFAGAYSGSTIRLYRNGDLVKEQSTTEFNNNLVWENDWKH
jgi:hypothetical protein